MNKLINLKLSIPDKEHQYQYTIIFDIHFQFEDVYLTIKEYIKKNKYYKEPSDNFNINSDYGE